MIWGVPGVPVPARVPMGVTTLFTSRSVGRDCPSPTGPSAGMGVGSSTRLGELMRQEPGGGAGRGQTADPTGGEDPYWTLGQWLGHLPRGS